MDIQTQMRLSLMQVNNSYDKLGTDMNLYIVQQKSLGVNPIEVKNQLLKDLQNRTGVFREVFSYFKNERMSNYNITAEVSSNQFIENNNLKYEWYLDPDVREHCDDCLKREDEGSKSYSYWKKIGLPATGHTECGAYCKCTLVPSENDEETKLPKIEVSEKFIQSVMDRAKKSVAELESISRSIAKRIGGRTTSINLKSAGSIKRKAEAELGSNLTRLYDSARTTIIVDSKKMEGLRYELKQDKMFWASNDGRVNIQRKENYHGYQGILSNIKTKDGVVVEIQFNTAKMIYAKGSRESVIGIIGQKEYDKILKETGVVGGRGHYFYEKIRILDKKKLKTKSEKDELKRLINESKRYYSNFYG